MPAIDRIGDIDNAEWDAQDADDGDQGQAAGAAAGKGSGGNDGVDAMRAEQSRSRKIAVVTVHDSLLQEKLLIFSARNNAAAEVDASGPGRI